MINLAIAFPTYNRPKNVLRRINEIVSICPDNITAWISDNSESDLRIPADLLNRVKYVRNKTNIGGGANFIASLLVSRSDYVWLRGDDDRLCESQYRTVADNIYRSHDILILCPDLDEELEICSLREFFKNFEHSRSCGWLSTIVFKQSSLMPAVKWGYWGVHTGWVNVCLILGIFRENRNARCLLLPCSVLTDSFREDGRDARTWAVIDTCINNFPRTFELIDDPFARDLAWKKWRKSQDINIVRSYIRSRLNLAPLETINLKTLTNLLDIFSLKSIILTILLSLAWFTPKSFLIISFSVLYPFLSQSLKDELQIPKLGNMSTYQRFRFLSDKRRYIVAKKFL